MQLKATSLPEHHLLEVSGEVDLLQAPTLRAALRESIERQVGTLILDLGAVTFMDSSGLSELIAFKQEAGGSGRNLIISRVSSEVRDLFALAQLDRFFCVDPSA
jgi:anti-sigma B factor antagonist